MRVNEHSCRLTYSRSFLKIAVKMV